ncbi:hypothetical protein P691DRAFT_252801 [Macrolepiota fuliginosa MF-IS2]|uniref:Uncharacterized protein n=1 Tax=Macrolepiota fuliginosa MF-IS2 TaxID=1400762 RepID=A0A9P5X9W3_9AGAR|nr:hypothetical protein P691DRAFT_252801 [Macrolepiota fuliginosa MF-IS2]
MRRLDTNSNTALGPSSPLSPLRRSGTPVSLDYPGPNPFTTDETKSSYHDTTPPKSNESHILLSTSSHENRSVTSLGQGLPYASSPAQMSFPPNRFPASRTTRLDVLQYVASKTSLWVLTGVTLMLLGIGVVHAAILPKIHTCPISATCEGSYDPNTGNSLQLLQAFMSYWLKAGVTMASVGILKLSAYQAWFVLMHSGNTLKNLDLNLGAIRGSVNDAGHLLFQKNNRVLSLFVFALLGVGAAISLVTGLSIEKEIGSRVVTFQFNGTSQFPDSSLARLNNDGQLKAIQKVIPWALDNDQSHDNALKGTLVAPGARSAQASNALPGGPKITGWFECDGWNNYTIVEPNSSWYIWIGSTRFTATADMSISVSMWRVDTAEAMYLWVSNTTGLIPNATQTTDGGMNIALCTHWLQMEPEEPRKPGVDYLLPNLPVTSGCDSNDKNVCVADAVNNAILSWWGGRGTAFWHITCRGGVLGPVPDSTPAERYCPLTQDLWRNTVTSMMDGIMQTAPSSFVAVQDLQAVVEVLNAPRWWLNAIIPAATLGLYLAGLAYTCALSQGDNVLKELSLQEVIEAAQTDHIHDLILAKQLKRTPIRYNSDIGFVGSNNHSTTTLART